MGDAVTYGRAGDAADQARDPTCRVGSVGGEAGEVYLSFRPVGRNRAALRRMMGAEIRNRLNPCSTIVAPGASATLVLF